MDKKNMIAMVAVGVVFAGIGFFGGMKYGQTPKALASISSTQKQALVSSLRTTNGGTGGAGFMGRRGMGGANGGFVAGQIIAKDEKSITIQLPNNGGSKIVFLAASSTVSKSTAGAITDLATGETVTVTGSPNSDGSITAQNIAIRPTMTTPPAAQ